MAKAAGTWDTTSKMWMSGPGMPPEYYGLVYEGTSWKIDSYRPGHILGK
jgi:hypothetical protein